MYINDLYKSDSKVVNKHVNIIKRRVKLLF
jgi:hypothetical protein